MEDEEIDSDTDDAPKEDGYEGEAYKAFVETMSDAEDDGVRFEEEVDDTVDELWSTNAESEVDHTTKHEEIRTLMYTVIAMSIGSRARMMKGRPTTSLMRWETVRFFRSTGAQ